MFSLSAVLAGFMRIMLMWAQLHISYGIGADLSYQIYENTLYQLTKYILQEIVVK